MRTLTFQFIVDSRFNENKRLLLAMDKQLKTKMANLPVELKETEPRKLVWDNDDLMPFDKGTQWRKRYYIRKTRAITWNDIYGVVNSIKPVPYDFV